MAKIETPRKAKQASGLKKTSRTIGDGITSRTVNEIDCTRSSGKAVVAALQKVLLAAMVENPQPIRNQEQKRGQAESPNPLKRLVGHAGIEPANLGQKKQ
jgi:hypothetical protein